MRAVLVLAHPGDLGAEAVAAAIADRCGPGTAVVIRPGELLGATRWSHAIDPGGAVSGTLQAREITLEHGDVAAVLNRITHIEPPGFARSPVAERDYATVELQALLVSWLAGLGAPVVNPAATALGTPTHRQWLARGAAVGLPVARELVATSERMLGSGDGQLATVVRGPWPQTPHVARQPVAAFDAGASQLAPLVTALVAGDRVLGDVPEAVADRCLALARTCGYTLLELRFRAGRGGALRLCEVDPLPPLLSLAAVHAVADLLLAPVRATSS